jgi:hypothetical protein
MVVNTMKKYMLITLSILLLTGSLFSVSFAWFTYVQRKSVASFYSNEILVDLEVNDTIFIDDYVLGDLAFIDYQNDFIDDQYLLLDSLASSIILNIGLSENSPLTRHQIEINNLSNQGLLFYIIFEGVNLPLEHVFESVYHSELITIMNGLTLKSEQLAALDLYNASVLSEVMNTLIFPGDIITIQLVIWGDYDGLVIKDDYLNQSYLLELSIESINWRGVS